MTREEMLDLVRHYPAEYDGPGISESVSRYGRPLAPDEELHLRFEIVRVRSGERRMVEERVAALVGEVPARHALADATPEEVHVVASLDERHVRRWAEQRLAGDRGTAYAAEAARAGRIAVELISEAGRQLRDLVTLTGESNAVAQVLLSRLTDTTHLTVAEAAQLKRVSTKTIRNWIAKGLLHLERVPGTRRSGIHTSELMSGWLSLDAAQRHLKRSRP